MEFGYIINVNCDHDQGACSPKETFWGVGGTKYLLISLQNHDIHVPIVAAGTCKGYTLAS